MPGIGKGRKFSRRHTRLHKTTIDSGYPLTLTLSRGGEREQKVAARRNRKKNFYIPPRPFGERDGVRANKIFRKG
jgi:hypothetical protein